MLEKYCSPSKQLMRKHDLNTYLESKALIMLPLNQLKLRSCMAGRIFHGLPNAHF